MSGSSTTPYDPLILSEDEKKRFIAALWDRFGDPPYGRLARNASDWRVPTAVEPGLLQHRVYYQGREGYGEDEEDGEFWEASDGDEPPGLFEQCPIQFHLPSVIEYFEAQRKAYLNHTQSPERLGWLKGLEPDERENWEAELYSLALYKTYSKALYEYHINEHISFLARNEAILKIGSKSRYAFGVLLLINCSAVLGRLIEQYYWKFFLEKSAIRGVKISESAKSGGAALASKRRNELAKWQAEALQVWNEHPGYSKMMVAAILKKRLRITKTCKHISRFIRRP